MLWADYGAIRVLDRPLGGVDSTQWRGQLIAWNKVEALLLQSLRELKEFRDPLFPDLRVPLEHFGSIQLVAHR
jgi:hypothetical protein